MNEDFSILVPTYNEEGNIKKCLESILVQKMPKGVSAEVTVIPNGCTDKTERIVKDFIKSPKTKNNQQIKWQTLTLKEGHKAKALNAGRKITKNDLVFSVDADCYLAKDAIYKIYQKVNGNDQIKAFGGYYAADFKGRKTSTFLYQVQKTHEIVREVDPSIFIVGRLMGFRKKFIPDFPLNTASDDTWLTLYTAKHHGQESVRVFKESIVYFYHPKTWLEYLSQHARFSQAVTHLIKKHKSLKSMSDTYDKRYLKERDPKRDNKIITKMKKANIDPQLLQHMRSFLGPMVHEWADEISKDPDFNKGKWEVMKSTKK